MTNKRTEPAFADYPHHALVPTRWNDNDVYGHVNNVVFYSYFDTVINAWLIAEGELDPKSDGIIGLCIESKCNYHAPATYPDALDVGLRVSKMGRTSVTYELAVFRAGDGGGTATLLATGHFVHVFVDRESRRPAPIPDRIRAALTPLLVP